MERWTVRALFIATAALWLFTLFNDEGFVKMLKARREKERIYLRISELKARNSELEKQVHLLRTDLRYIERIAKDEMGLVRPDEIVVFFGD